MQPSIFNVQVPLEQRNEVFLMNTFTDAQVIVSPEVTALMARLGGPDAPPAGAFTPEERATINELAEWGFVVPDHASERRALDEFFHKVRHDTAEMRLTVLTTLQCNFACDYCFQGDHGDHNKFAHKMSLETAGRVVDWTVARFDDLSPETFTLTFFGGEPLLNLPVLYDIAERLWNASVERGIRMRISIITNGLLLTPAIVDRLLPFGLVGVKITLDGDQATHDRMRPLRGGQGTFDRIIENVRAVAGRCRVNIGGNFDESSVDSYPALLDFLKEQSFSPHISRVNFKPIIRTTPATPKGVIALTAVNGDGRPLNGTCMTTAGSGGANPCDLCHFVDEKTAFLREETKKRGFETADGVHMGPCELHFDHAYTIGPDGALYACPGFTGDASLSTGHIDGRREAPRDTAAARFADLAAWRKCGDCSFIPVCAGGCAVASHTELGDMNTPTCHKTGFESALMALAHEAAAAQEVA
jgi:uncharacterized protein